MYKVTLDYCTGQYFPTEYRKAACAVLAAALWDYQSTSMPPAGHFQARTWAELGKPHGEQLGVYPTRGEAEEKIAASGGRKVGHVVELHDGLSPGDWLRRSFRREFGRGLAQAYFN